MSAFELSDHLTQNMHFWSRDRAETGGQSNLQGCKHHLAGYFAVVRALFAGLQGCNSVPDVLYFKQSFPAPFLTEAKALRFSIQHRRKRLISCPKDDRC